MPFFNTWVPKDYCGTLRLDQYVAADPNGITRSKLKNGITQTFLNGQPAKLSTKVKAGDQIDIEWEENVPSDISPENIPLDIIFENEDVAVINKRQGMVVHPASGNWTGTLVNALLYHWGRESVPQIVKGPVSTILSARRPGIVHRLDKDTSGVIITAKNSKAEDWLQRQFQCRRVKKEYIAIVCGHPPAVAGDIRTQIIRDPRNRKRFKAVVGTTMGKSSRTLYHCLAVYGNYSLMRLRLKTGRTHQIRVHMKYLGCPILGDSIYGKKDKIFDTATLMLHARLLCIRLPGNKRFSKFIGPVPLRFKEVLYVLHNNFHKTVLPTLGIEK